MGYDLLPRKKLGRIFVTLGIFLFPLMSCLYVVSIFSNDLITDTMSIFVLITAIFSFLLLITGLVFLKTGTDKIRRMKWPVRVALTLFAIMWTVGGYTVLGLLYLPGTGFKDWLITTAMTTMNHRYLATWFYDSYEVNMVMANNTVIESGEDTNPDLISFKEPNFNQETYKNKY